LPGIFINYRREDSGGYAQQIYRALRSAFGAKLVFMDIDTIRSGEDYRAIIRRSIGQSDVFLTIIGRAWLRSLDDKGHRRLDSPNDLVRREIAQALEANLYVVPVLVGRAQMPRAVDLPEDLKALASRNAHEIPDRFFDASVRQLIQNIRLHVRGGNAIPRRNLLRAALGAAGAFGRIIVLSVLKSRPDLPTGEQKAVDATEKRHDAFEALVKQSPKQPPLLLREPPPIHELPAEVPGPWRIDRADFTSFVAGPRREPKPVWIARPSKGGSTWKALPQTTINILFVSSELALSANTALPQPGWKSPAG
jgi:hypothetical protein